MQIDLNDHERLALSLAAQGQLVTLQALVAKLNPPAAQQPEASPEVPPQGAEPAADTPAQQ